MEMTHHLIYVKRRVTHAPENAEELESLALGALDRPVAHLFGYAFLADRLKQKNKRHALWFVTALAVGRSKMPFGLDARMLVQRVLRDPEDVADPVCTGGDAAATTALSGCACLRGDCRR